MDTRPQDDWERLGTALRRRRGELGYGFRQRVQFAQDVGIGAKTISRMENGERSGYPAETLAQAEIAYQLRPGAISRFLAGAPELETQQADGGTAEQAAESDPAIDAIWRIPGLSDEVKRGLAALARGMREQEDNGANGGRRQA